MSLVRRVCIASFDGDAGASREDAVAHEEPLEIQVQGVSCAVVMRTPGDDEDLAIGFLTTERVIGGIGDIASVRHCTAAADPEALENVIRVVLREGITLPWDRLRRHTFASSSCGVCGKATIEAALHHGPPLQGGIELSAAVLYDLPAELRKAQRAFDETGGLHAAALFDIRGALCFVREDVGRHNAADKVIGAALRAGIPASELGMLVSGRIGFEIVQKAAAAGISLVAGISAPTSLATRFGDALGVTVIGFLRGRSMNVYAHPERIRAAEPVGPLRPLRPGTSEF
jgi:FdhD protein